ncbi:hypothetical protein K488DRAFT_60564 [Vararia minispora EC-137]|uniref:Uncharacterized protein n=1 Tax=Vararia minispora EC-137 TaxID=1314806 RepID=A0ACB8Q7J2_9AGAM|nr:hypothetical protein K488DRAFT_60564 [Vararia minispora EC-137]
MDFSLAHFDHPPPDYVTSTDPPDAHVVSGPRNLVYLSTASEVERDVPSLPFVPPPDYSVEPGTGEQRLAHSTGRRRSHQHEGVLRRSHNTVCVALRGQNEQARRPAYGRGLILGNVAIMNSHNTTSVTMTVSSTTSPSACSKITWLQIEGRMDIGLGDAAKTRWTFMSTTCTLWKGDGPCPSVLPLECVIPETFVDPADGRQRPLPPTYDPSNSSLRDMHTRVSYRIIIRVTEEKFAGLWKPRRSNSLVVPFDYIPRARPHRPVLVSPFPFLSFVKSTPEEWHQVNVPIASVLPSLSGVDCNLFIPDVQIYGKEDTIPFFLQLCAPALSMREFFHPTLPVQKVHRSRSSHNPSDSDPSIRVYIKRQTTGMSRGEKLSRSYVIAEGVLCPIPPGSSPGGHAPSEELAVDYEGKLVISAEVTVGSFNIGRLSVLDFIVLSVIPCNLHTPLFEEVNHSHPIRIVTDSYRYD